MPCCVLGPLDTAFNRIFLDMLQLCMVMGLSYPFFFFHRWSIHLTLHWYRYCPTSQLLNTIKELKCLNLHSKFWKNNRHLRAGLPVIYFVLYAPELSSLSCFFNFLKLQIYFYFCFVDRIAMELVLRRANVQPRVALPVEIVLQGKIFLSSRSQQNESLFLGFLKEVLFYFY